MQNEILCEKCGETLFKVDHIEYDGVEPNGSPEPYWECPNGCYEPEEPLSCCGVEVVNGFCPICKEHC